MPAVLAIAATDQPSHTLVSLAGDCDITNAHLLQKIMTGYIPADARLAVIDLSGLRFIDAAEYTDWSMPAMSWPRTGRHWPWPRHSRP